MLTLRNKFYIYFLGLSLIPLVITLAVLLMSMSVKTKDIFISNTQDLLSLQAEKLIDTVDRYL
jgi:hypothetical protein